MSIWDQLVLRGDWEVSDLRSLTPEELKIAKDYYDNIRGSTLGHKTGIL